MEELSKEGACERAIFPDTNIVVNRCAMIGNLSVEGVRKYIPQHENFLEELQNLMLSN